MMSHKGNNVMASTDIYTHTGKSSLRLVTSRLTNLTFKDVFLGLLSESSGFGIEIFRDDTVTIMTTETLVLVVCLLGAHTSRLILIL